MLDFLLELLLNFLGLLLEAAFEFAIEALGAFILRAIAEAFETSEFKTPILACVGYFCLGGLAGALSLLAFPQPLIHPSRLPGISLIVSPMLAV
jgi:hypothetical protein